ncbi:acyl-CoA thioester hydrolase, YbgC/YbaW family [Desulfosporosinus orientis DSM 765]|uniref:Acyl-CoA thioester hydrolase, YbgC/YbaW family n=1 Tax=Desulfosporosinus orientis (strain ATCC 19365 / DSM 765 / NCIMB 8382 / VKM B-1628 / Singapore I) TaxID=768706 RepID=G7W977_DESOD|nr:thioesterase family protein [Desulfosporosinus orientis]AET68718.1 acyl-CoA thioester hydrolase, YbgC/YbaW family [Desulfosporosinus orientis DSM 765]
MGLSAKTNLRVRYAETDKMGIVYHANYIVWFEVGRSALFRELNLPYTEFEKQGLGLAVIDANCRYRKPAQYDDEITIVTEIISMSARSITFSYRIIREKTLLAEGKTVHVFVNKEGKLTNVKSYEIWQDLQPIIEQQGHLQKNL